MKKALPWLLALVIVALVASGIWRGLRTQSERRSALAEAEQAKANAVYQLSARDVISVAPQQLPLTLPISGTVQAVNTATVKARVAGEIQQLQLREGDSVQAGQVLARVDVTESAARVAQAQQQADAARAQRDIQQRQYDNNQKLVNQGFISGTALEASRSQLQAAQSNYQAALSATQVLQKMLSDTVLRSPISGHIAKKWVSNGEKVGADAQVLEVVDLRQLELAAQIAPADSLRVHTGQRAQLQVDGHSQTISAQVARINPSADSSNRSVAVYLQIAPAESNSNAINKEAATALPLRAGLYLQGQLAVGTVQALAIPLSAVRTDKPEPYVQWIAPQAGGDTYAVQHQAVALGERALLGGNTWVAITQGLAAGQQVLGGQVGQLREGTVLRIQPTTPIAPAALPANPSSGG